jgi:plasmid rolling circle replication initiator protein Rep
MISTIIIIGFLVASALIYLIALQLGYIMGKRKAKEEIEDKYWNANMLVAQYSNEAKEKKLIANIKIDGSEINEGIYEKLTGKKIEDFSDIGDPYEDGGL